MRTASTNLDHQARYLIRVAEPELRKHLGVRRLGLDLVGELYVCIQDVLQLTCERAATGPHNTKQVVDEIALQMYLVAAAATESEAPAGPELLPALQRVLSGAMNDLSGLAFSGTPDTLTWGK